MVAKGDPSQKIGFKISFFYAFKDVAISFRRLLDGIFYQTEGVGVFLDLLIPGTNVEACLCIIVFYLQCFFFQVYNRPDEAARKKQGQDRGHSRNQQVQQDIMSRFF